MRRAAPVRRRPVLMFRPFRVPLLPVLPLALGALLLCGAAPCPDAAPDERPPSRSDDADYGYAPRDLWQACGTVWEAASVQPGAAVWQPLPSPGLPGDAFGAHTLFAGGSTRVVSGYAGPALDVSLTSGGQPRDATLDILADGTLDTTILRTRDPGTYATVTRVHDQSGHGNDLLATPGKPAVHIGEIAVNGAEALSWGEANGPGGFVLPPGLAVDGASVFFGTTGAFASSNSGFAAYPMPLLLGHDGPEHEIKLSFGGYQLDGFVHIGDSGSLDQHLDLVVTNAPAPFSLWAHDGVYDVRSGNDRATGRARIAPSQLAGGAIGFNTDGGPWFSQGPNTGLWTGMVLADHVTDAAMVTRFHAAAMAQGRDIPQSRPVVVTIGDSRTEGYLIADGQNWPRLMQRQGHYQGFNLAVSGATTRHMVGMLPAAAHVAARAGDRVAVVFGGYNDHLPSNGIGYDETIANLGRIVHALQGMGYRVVLVQEASTDPILRGRVRDALAAGDIRPDQTVDPFAPGMALSNPSDARYWNTDYTHPNLAGQAELASSLWPAVGGLLKQGASVP